MAACACFASSTGSPDRPVSLNIMPIGARVERIGVHATQPRPTTRVSPLWCSTIGQFSNTVKCAPSSSDRRNASRSVSLTSYMMWCSSTIVPAMSVPHVPSIALRWRSSRKMPTRLRPMRSLRQLDGAPEDRVRFLEGQDLVERREQRRQLAVHRLIDDLGHGDLRSEDDRPVHAPAPRRHGGSLTPARIAETGGHVDNGRVMATSRAWTTRSRTGWCCSGPAAISPTR